MGINCAAIPVRPFTRAPLGTRKTAAKSGLCAKRAAIA